MRNLGLSANQVLHIPGAGDFQIRQMRVLDKPAPLGSTRKARANQSSDNRNSVSAMEVSVADQAFIVPDPQQQEQLLRENEADELVGEQTWPTDKVHLSSLVLLWELGAARQEGLITFVVRTTGQRDDCMSCKYLIANSMLLHEAVPVA